MPPADPATPAAPADASATIAWPPALSLPPWLARLGWRALPADAPPAPSEARPPLVWLRYPAAAALQGLTLDVTLVLELDELVRVELRGPLDTPALAALGAGDDTLDDFAHHRLTRAATRITIDALDGLIALEPEEP